MLTSCTYKRKQFQFKNCNICKITVKESPLLQTVFGHQHQQIQAIKPSQNLKTYTLKVMAELRLPSWSKLNSSGWFSFQNTALWVQNPGTSSIVPQITMQGQLLPMGTIGCQQPATPPACSSALLRVVVWVYKSQECPARKNIRPNATPRWKLMAGVVFVVRAHIKALI